VFATPIQHGGQVLKEATMGGALDGIRVIDFGQYIAGPLTAMMLGDQGAEVIRVDPPGGPRWDTPANAVWNRGKRSIVLDLKIEADLTIAQQLIATADVVIENFRPGTVERLSIGPEAMTGAHPALIYCSLPGFAADDPRARIPAWEGVVGAAASSYNSRLPDTEPHYTALPLASNFAAFTAVNSVVAALIAREKTGTGQRIEAPLFDAMFEAFGIRGQRILGSDIPQAPLPGAGGPDPLGGGFYQCSDARWVQLLVMRPRHFDWFAAACFPAGWADEGLADRERLRAEPELAAELRRRLEDLFRTKTAEQWQRVVNEAGTPLCVCQTTAEWLDDEHARATRSVVELDDPEYGPMKQAGFPVDLTITPAADPEPRHTIDSDRAAILDELSSRPAPSHSASNAKRRGALDGIRVIDTTQIWAGPTAGRVLAEYGADVVKINDTSGDVLSHIHVNSGKRSLLLDLQSPAGLNVLWKLIERAQVFTQNFAMGTAERLGIGYDEVRAHRPDIVYSSISAYGYGGPRGGDRGWEPVGQAATGMELRMGGDSPQTQPFALCDYGTGLMGAFSVLLGLFHQARSGEGQQVQAALSMTGTLHQTPFMFDYEGRTWNEPTGPGAKGEGALQRLYEAEDRWFFLGARESELPLLEAVVGLGGLHDLDESALTAALTERFSTAAADAWVAKLTAAGLGAHALVTLEEVMEDPWAKEHDLSVVRDHEGVGPVRMVGPSPRLSATPVHVTDPARSPGADGPDVLTDLGMADAIDALVNEGAIALP
jgi:crotonobetainyl-CoA:carnitine CoA-transferase CaiB-like acyl-CoA transferase